MNGSRISGCDPGNICLLAPALVSTLIVATFYITVLLDLEALIHFIFTSLLTIMFIFRYNCMCRSFEESISNSHHASLSSCPELIS